MLAFVPNEGADYQNRNVEVGHSAPMLLEIRLNVALSRGRLRPSAAAGYDSDTCSQLLRNSVISIAAYPVSLSSVLICDVRGLPGNV